MAVLSDIRLVGNVLATRSRNGIYGIPLAVSLGKRRRMFGECAHFSKHYD